MSVPARLAAFALVLFVAAGGGAAIGAAVGPDPDSNPPVVEHEGHRATTAMKNGH